MNQKSNSVIGNQPIISEGISEGVSESAIEGVLEDLSVQNAEMIKGGPYGGGVGGDIVVFDIVDSHH